ncbi:hypothetical protein N9933_00995 [bacterium]|nr:hypothetical protein [bacterium]
MQKLILLILCATFFFACKEKIEVPSNDELAACNCSISMTDGPVCGEDGHFYLNSCYTDCLDIALADSADCLNTYVAEDTLSWPIERVCCPVSCPFEALYYRTDGTVIYKETATGRIFRGNQNMCVCLPPTAHIGTSGGEVAIATIEIGDSVWTVDGSGSRISAPVLFVSRANVRPTHQLLSLKLKDGRELSVSALHPDANGIPLEQYSLGDTLAGSVIIHYELIPYEDTYTMDIYVDGPMNSYFANGILIGSTLKELPLP